MAIRKMEFTKGDELNIRSFPRIENKYITENLEDLRKNETALIVKCGKSFWDVSEKPEIFEQAEEFDPEELTGIEKKEMQQAAASPLAHAYEDRKESEQEDNDPMSMLYQKTEEEEVQIEYLSRKTFYANPVILAIIDTYCFRNRTDVSEAIRELILRGTPEDIVEEAQKRAAEYLKTAPKKTRKKNRVII